MKNIQILVFFFIFGSITINLQNISELTGISTDYILIASAIIVAIFIVYNHKK